MTASGRHYEIVVRVQKMRAAQSQPQVRVSAVEGNHMNSFARTCVALLVLAAFALPASAADWKPLDPAHLALKQPTIDPAAGAEALLWEVRIADELDTRGEPMTIYEHYLRVKIFTDRGREAFATVDIPFATGIDVRDVAARTVRADGSIVELKKSDIYERTIVKSNDLKVKVKSFAIPALDRGVIVDYTWREYHRDSLATNLQLKFSRDIPVHDVRYYLRPLSIPGYGMVAFPFNGDFGPPQKQKDGYTMLALTKVPAQVDEEFGLPELEERPWVFIGYEASGRSDSDFDKRLSKDLHEEYSKRARPNDEIRKLAAAAVTGATTDAAKISALARVARGKIRRVDVDTADPADRLKVKETKNATESLSRGVGTADDVLLLFLALADAARLDARATAITSRAQLFPRSLRPHPAFMPERIAAVRSGAAWLFVDPANQYSAGGELPWQFEMQRALIGDPRDAVSAETPSSPPAYSVKKRFGTFRLLEDGTLEGEARLEYTGHWGELLRDQEDQETAAAREKDLREFVTKRLPGAELSEVRIENIPDPSKPYTNAYKIRMTGYAQRAGNRLILQPAIFQKGGTQTFAEPERKSRLHFPFAWSEEDVISIELPDGYAPEQSINLQTIDVGAAKYEPQLTLTGSKLTYKRGLSLATSGLFEVNIYQPFRAFFEAVHKADSQPVVLRKKDAK
jgi:transglutaminase-like putative cysteine protease